MEPVAASSGRALPAIVGIVGAGTMGAGIGQVALEAGCEVVFYDVDEAAVDAARERILDGLARRAVKRGLHAAEADDWVEARLDRIRHVPTVDGLADEADLVIESAMEDLALKRTIFRTLDAAAPPETILATNTSALSIAAIAAATNRQGRVIGMHFFNPAPVMPLVEIVSAPKTDPTIAAAATALVERWGKTAVSCADTPGFIVNRVNRPFTIEALRLVETGIASVAAIDEALTAAGFPMGPFELMDLVGVDINLAAATAIWNGLGQPERLRPSSIQERLVAAGDLGRKTGRGFYDYRDGPRAGVSEEFVGRGSTIEADSIRERILTAIGREAHRALDEGVASAADIDIALRLGAGHPIGPFERERTEADGVDRAEPDGDE